MSEASIIQGIERRLMSLGQYDNERAMLETTIVVAEALCSIARSLDSAVTHNLNVDVKMRGDRS